MIQNLASVLDVTVEVKLNNNTGGDNTGGDNTGDTTQLFFLASKPEMVGQY
jgi:hypothetical protein